ncbi:hypothetical protein Gotri_023721 [Gossypium trilobum]|uniref:Uncharacterized protein n=1 Tax=Gossypium trilobum TaxID=34281 RepID=A0A7J9DK06_9ROSI|nr:hypothetical protein [Gossypium trilobum]
MVWLGLTKVLQPFGGSWMC